MSLSSSSPGHRRSREIILKAHSDDMEADSKDIPAFELHGGGIQNRLKDVFGCLDDLEVKHKAFEQTRASEDADSDRRLIHDSPSPEDMETITGNSKFKHPGALTGRDYHSPSRGSRHGHTRIGHNVEFKKPMPPPIVGNRGQSFRGRFGRGRSPDYKVHPERWTEYSLEDVDVSDASNKKAAFSFLQERRALQETDVKENAEDLNNACSKGQILFKRPNKTKSTESSKQDKAKDKLTNAVSVDMESSSEEVCEGGDVEMEDVEAKSKASVSDLKVEKLSLKRKHDETEDRSMSDVAGSSEKQVEFKSRKSSKRQIRSRRDRDEDSD